MFLLRTHETFANLNRSHLIAFKVRFEDLGYRRFEWKCDALNAPSREAAERFGFSFEGIFRQAVVTRGVIEIPHGTQSLTVSTRHFDRPTICGSMSVISIIRDGRLGVLAS